MQAKPPASVTAYQRVAHELRHLIVEEHLPAGTCVGTEQELCDRWHASRTTVRRALLELAKEGLVVSHQGKGWFVSEPRVTQQLAQLEALSDILLRYGKSSHKITAFRSVRPPDRVAEAFEIDADSSMVLEIERVHFLNDEPIAVTRIWLVDWVGDHLSKDDARSGPIFPRLPDKTGIWVDYSNQTIRSAGVSANDATRLKVKADSHALEVDRVCYTKEGAPVAVVLIVYRADRFELRMSLKWREADSWQAIIAPGIGLSNGGDSSGAHAKTSPESSS